MARRPGFGEPGGRIDANGMLDLVRALPAHMADAWDRGKRFAATLSARQVGRVVVCGMGGSAIGGDMARSYLGDRLACTLHVNRGYTVPATLQRDAFFIFSSYTGNTAETLSAYEKVREIGAPAAAITSGGQLGKRCKNDGVPCCEIPAGMPPRAAIAFSFFPLLLTLEALGLAKIAEPEYNEALVSLERQCGEFGSQGANEAADLAGRLEGKLPFVYSCGGLFRAVARRWSCQFNENSKTLAHFAVFSELSHNEISGWEVHESLRRRIAVISLEDEEDHPMTLRQADVALDMIKSAAGVVQRVPSVKGSRMTRILSAVNLGDFVSVYLAYLNGVDPTPIPNIDYLKERLRRSVQ